MARGDLPLRSQPTPFRYLKRKETKEAVVWLHSPESFESFPPKFILLYFLSYKGFPVSYAIANTNLPRR